MWMLFKEGGWSMWFIFVVGAIALATSFWFVLRPAERQLGFIKWLSRALLYAVASGLCVNVSTVLHYLARDPDQLTAEMRTRLMIEGFGESLAPGVMGFAFLTLIALVTAVGQRRLDSAKGLA